MADATEAQTEERRLVGDFLLHRSEESFRLLYRRHTPRLYLLALRLVGGRREDAEDAVQEAWIRAVPRLAAFEWRSQLSTWLAGIVINCAREGLRRRSRVQAGPLEPGREPAGAAPFPPGARLDLEAALLRLPDGFREVLVLHDLEGHTHEEIAALFGIDPGTSRSQLHRARRRLRELLGARSETP